MMDTNDHDGAEIGLSFTRRMPISWQRMESHSDAFETEARRAPVAWVQRLGYLLVLVEQNALADRLDGVLEQRKVFTVPLAPWRGMEGMPRDSRWKVAINTDVEPDL